MPKINGIHRLHKYGENYNSEIVRFDKVGLLHVVHPELVSQSVVGGCACCCLGGVLGLSSRSGAPS